jgi:hypothetical protein
MYAAIWDFLVLVFRTTHLEIQVTAYPRQIGSSDKQLPMAACVHGTRERDLLAAIPCVSHIVRSRIVRSRNSRRSHPPRSVSLTRDRPFGRVSTKGPLSIRRRKHRADDLMTRGNHYGSTNSVIDDKGDRRADRNGGAHEALSDCRPASSGEAGRRFARPILLAAVVTAQALPVQYQPSSCIPCRQAEQPS